MPIEMEQQIFYFDLNLPFIASQFQQDPQMKQKKKKSKSKGKGKDKKRRISYQDECQRKLIDSIELQQSSRKPHKHRSRCHNSKQRQKHKDKHKSRDNQHRDRHKDNSISKRNTQSHKSLLQPIQVQRQLSAQDFRQMVSGISRRYESQARKLILDEKYWQRQKQKQQLRQLRELNKMIKEELVETSMLEDQIVQKGKCEQLGQEKVVKVNGIAQLEGVVKVNVRDRVNSHTNPTQCNSNENKQSVKLQCLQNTQLLSKKQLQSQYLHQLLQSESNYTEDDDNQQTSGQRLQKGFKTKHKLKSYLLTLSHQHNKAQSKITITDLQGTFWQLKLDTKYLTQLKNSLNLTSSLRTFITYFVKSLHSHSKLKQLDRLSHKSISNIIELQIDLAIGEGLLMNCTIEIPRLISLQQVFVSRKQSKKVIQRREKRREYDKMMRKFMLGVYEIKEQELQRERNNWRQLASVITNKSNIINNDHSNNKNKQIKQSLITTQSSSSKKHIHQSNANQQPQPQVQPDKIREMITNSIMLSIQNPLFLPNQHNNFTSYNNSDAVNQTSNDLNQDKTKQINKKYKTDLMNPNRIRRKKQKGVKLFE